MKKKNTVATVALAFAGAAALWTASPLHAIAAQSTTTAPGERSVWTGVYTDAQSKRGDKAYADTCASCHAADLKGSQVVPALVGEDFLTKWNGSMAGDMFELIRTTMPQDSPGSLTPAQYADVLAFIFDKNKIPNGKTELAGDFEALKTIRIDAKKP